MRLTSLLAALVSMSVTASARSALAYPQFQLTTGADRCQACHVSPGGGGLLNAYGRDEAGSTISSAGDGRFLHGLWEPPSWLGLGGELRGAVGIKDQEDRTRTLAFPMQADLDARAVVGPWSFNVIAGVRGTARDPKPELIYRLASREHFLMYQREPGSGWYARVGRFFPIYGLRSQDHTAYVRRYLGQGTLEEPYALAVGHLGDHAEWHLTMFVPQPIAQLGAGSQSYGAAAYYERRVDDDRAAWAVQAKVASSSQDLRTSVGAVGKLWLEPAGLQVLGELDLQRQSFEVGTARIQIASYFGVSRLLLPGWLVTAAVQQWEPDLLLRSSARTATELNLQYFPRAHLELHWLGRIEGVGNDFDHPALLSLLQLHYTL
jgi:hypothetical protein